MAQRRRKPQEGGTPERVIPPLGWLFLACALGMYFFAFQIPWIGKLCIFMGNVSLLLAVGCFGYWLFLHPEKVHFLKAKTHYSGSKLDLAVIYSASMNNFLYQAKAVIPDPYDPRYQQVPLVNQTRNGLRIEAIGNLRGWLISDNFRDSLESFLNRHGYDVSIQSASYKQDGWVYYTLIRGIKSDRLRF